jgi:hypothetical protein
MTPYLSLTVLLSVLYTVLLRGSTLYYVKAEVMTCGLNSTFKNYLLGEPDFWS